MRVKALFIILLFFTSSSWGKSPILDQVITIEITNTPIKNILKTIETKATVKFSYNPALIDENKRVSLSLKQQTIRYGLELIFEQDIYFKEVGDHILILKQEDKADIKLRKKSHLEYVFTGKVIDAESQEVIKGASIYEVQTRTATISDNQGLYFMRVAQDKEIRSLYISKKGYHEKAIVLVANESSHFSNNVELQPLGENIEKLHPHEVVPISQPIEERAISGILVSDETFIHSENLSKVEETRIAQISLVPSLSIGSNLSTNGLIYNHFSLNVLAGYSKGVKGAEIGSIMNIVKENVTGGQVAGIVNLVGGNVLGGQVGGLASLVQGNVSGAQVSGISSITKQDLLGVQIGGISSVVRGGMTGLQISGISSIAFENSRGVQISGIHNLVRDSLHGVQISGIGNNSKGGYSYAQLSGIYNYAGDNIGLQASGIFNFAHENKGVQIGLINASKKGKGVSIGLFNFVKEGYHKTEISANELFQLNLQAKTGTQRFYNTYHVGVRFAENPAYAVGLGFGTYFNLSDRWMISLDATADVINENKFSSWEFSNLYKFSTTIDFKLAKWITLFAGPSFNTHIMQFVDAEGNYSSTVTGNSIYTDTFNQGETNLWIGGQVGIRL